MEVFRIFELEYISSLQSSIAPNVLNFSHSFNPKRGYLRKIKRGTDAKNSPARLPLCIPPTPQNKKRARRLKGEIHAYRNPEPQTS
jgi:hypothetical protein